MNLILPIHLAKGYTSPSQIARRIVEPWVEKEIACPNCGFAPLTSYKNNHPAADLNCAKCHEDYQVKGSKKKIGKKLRGADYHITLENVGKINFIIVYYNSQNWSVRDVIIVPKYFITPECIIPSKPLPETAKRAGWPGCDVLVPEYGRIYWIKSGVVQSFQTVRTLWNRRIKLVEDKTFEARTWLIDVIFYIEKLRKKTFMLQDLYKFEAELRDKHLNNKHVKDKLRQQLQILRDRGYLKFLGDGNYEIV